MSIDGTAVNSTSDITGIIGEHAVGDTIEVQVVQRYADRYSERHAGGIHAAASSTQRTGG